jgi:hypothetical protein
LGTVTLAQPAKAAPSTPVVAALCAAEILGLAGFSIVRAAHDADRFGLARPRPAHPWSRSAHNLVVEAVDRRLDTTTPLAGPVSYPAVDLLLGRLQVTAFDDRPGWGLRRVGPMKTASDSERRRCLDEHCQTLRYNESSPAMSACYGQWASNLADAQGVEMRDKGHSVYVLRTGDPARSLGVIYASLLTF